MLALKTLFLVLAAAAAVSGRPGGYTANGGVFQFDPHRELDYMDQAIHAGKFAWNLRFEQELDSQDVNRNERNTGAYVPTFFTSHQNHDALTAAAAAQPVRIVRKF